MEVLSTLPHYVAVYLAPDLFYGTVVWCSTTLSVLWHSGLDYLMIPDHVMAFLWFLTDVYYFWNTGYFTIMLLSNLTIAGLDLVMNHSLWHLVSSTKAIVLSQVLVHSRTLQFHLEADDE